MIDNNFADLDLADLKGMLRSRQGYCREGTASGGNGTPGGRSDGPRTRIHVGGPLWRQYQAKPGGGTEIRESGRRDKDVERSQAGNRIGSGMHWHQDGRWKNWQSDGKPSDA